MNTVKSIDKNGQEYFLKYQMKQPFAVDLTYKLTLVTGKYELLNTFNLLLQEIFKSGYAYLPVNGHYVYIKMENISDESEYAIDDRRYFSQTAQLIVKAYIIQKEDFIIKECPKLKFSVSEMNSNVSIEMEEDEDEIVVIDDLYYKPLTLIIDFQECEWNEVRTRLPYKMVVKKTTLENVKTLKITIGSEVIENINNFEFQEASLTKIWIRRDNPLKASKIIFEGYDKDVILDNEDEEFMGEDLTLQS